MTPRLKVKTTRRKGRGVFANCRIKKGEIIEVAPVIILSRQEETVLSKMRRLYSFCYNWGSNEKQTAFVMGCGSFYNHSYDPNTTHYNLSKQRVVVFRALRGYCQRGGANTQLQRLSRRSKSHPIRQKFVGKHVRSFSDN